MSYANDVIEFNGYKCNETNDYLWQNNGEKHNLTSIADKNLYEFSVKSHDETKIAYPNEDFRLPSGGNTNEYYTDCFGYRSNYQDESVNDDDDTNNFDCFVNPNNMNIDVLGDHNGDGFASRDVILIGGATEEDNEDISPDSRVPRLGDEYWSTSEYNTVVRSRPSTQSNRTVDASNKYKTRTPSEMVTSATDEDQLCASCNTRVYVTEKLVIDTVLYHRHCFKCSKCRRLLNMNNFAACGKRLFCQTHFVELFRQSGDYNNLQEKSVDTYNNDKSAPEQMTSSEPMKSIVEKFKQMETVSNYEQKQFQQRPQKTSKFLSRTRNLSTEIRNQDMYSEKMNMKDDDKDELPVPGFTKSLLSLWTNIESKESVSPRGFLSGSGTPKKVYHRTSSQVITPSPRDIIKHDEQLQDERPPPQIAKMVAAKFREIERKAPPPLPNSNKNKNNNVGVIKLKKSIIKESQCAKNIPNRSTNKNSNIDIKSSKADALTTSTRSNPSNQMSEFVCDNNFTCDPSEFPEIGTTKNLVGFFSGAVNY